MQKSLVITQREDWVRELTINKLDKIENYYQVIFSSHYTDGGKERESRYEMFMTDEEIQSIKDFL